MTVHYRERRMSEIQIRYRTDEVAGRWVVRDGETGQLVPNADYDTKALAKTQCRMLVAREIESLFLPDRATAVTKVAAIITGQSDPVWAAQLICDYFDGSKA